MKIRFEGFSRQEIANELNFLWWYRACNWWAIRCMQDFYSPPLPYRSWDMKVSAVIFTIVFFADFSLSMAVRATGAHSGLTTEMTYTCDIAAFLEYAHRSNLRKWRRRVHNDWR